MKSLLKVTGLLIAGLVLVGKVHASEATGMNVIEGSKHDFTLKFAGGVAGAAVSQCSTCHEMHKPVKMKPLWARQNPDANLNWIVKSGALPPEYTNTSFDNGTSTMTAGSLIPKSAFVDSRSGLCLSCHDGTQTVSDGGMITGRANLTIAPGDLSQNHRIGNERLSPSARTSGGVTTITVLSDAVLKAGDAVTITNANGVAKTRYFVGCTTCHSMHSSPMENRKLLVNSRDYSHGPVCLDCHGGK
jgi:predicted CXXCH cytochrome family protein